MPITSEGMKQAMLDELNFTVGDGVDAKTKEVIEDQIGLLAKAIVNYIKSNALVSTTVVGTCPLGGGPLTGGTGVGSIS